MEEFLQLEKRLLEMGFRKILKSEVAKHITSSNLKQPRERSGREVGFLLHSNGLDVYVWTTWVEKDEFARESDSAWVLISEGKTGLWYNPRIHRTKHFISRLLARARYARERVLQRPLCPKCNQYMNIVKGKSLHSVYWRCARRDLHKNGESVSLGWDIGMPPELIAEQKRIRKIRSKQKQRQLLKDLERGEPSVPSRISRKTWRHGQKPRTAK